ncbi:recombinase family protein [Candidatus Poribacteria bacterium]
MKVIGYIRVSADKQDLEQQRHLLLDYAQKNHLLVNEFIHAEVSSRKDTKERKIDELLTKLARGDMLLVAELNRLGRNMLETLNIINELSQNGVSIVFVRQPELSTIGTHTKLLLTIYSYFAKAEREYISMRTKQGLAVARAKGKLLGRPKGSKNKNRVLDPYKEQIKEYLQMGLNLAAIMKIVNNQLEKHVSYNTLKYFVQHDRELLPLWQARKLNRIADAQTPLKASELTTDKVIV